MSKSSQMNVPIRPKNNEETQTDVKYMRIYIQSDSL